MTRAICEDLPVSLPKILTNFETGLSRCTDGVLSTLPQFETWHSYSISCRQSKVRDLMFPMDASTAAGILTFHFEVARRVPWLPQRPHYVLRAENRGFSQKDGNREKY